MASVPLAVELELDRRSATAVANDVERAMADAGRNISRDFSRTMSGLNSGDMRRVGQNIGNNLRDGIRGSMDEAVRGVTSQFGAMGQAADSTFSGMSTKAKVGAVGIAGIGLAAIGVVKQFHDMGAQWDNVVDGITGRTGLIGAELTALTNTVKDLASVTATPIANIGDIAGQVQQSLNLTGDAAERMIQTLAQVQQLTGQGVNVRGLGQTFRLFDISDTDAQVTAVEDLLRVSQATGVGIDQLVGSIQQSGKAAKEFGMDFSSTAGLIATMENAGLDFARTAPSLSIALKNFAKDGREPQEALRETIAEIKNLTDAGRDAEAVALAQGTFGRGYIDFLDAIKGGSLTVDTLNSALDRTGASLDEQITATEDWAEEWQKLQNQMETGLLPAATAVFGTINQGLEFQKNLIQDVRDGFLNMFTGAPTQVLDELQAKLNELNGAVAGVGPRGAPGAMTPPRTPSAGSSIVDQRLNPTFNAPPFSSGAPGQWLPWNPPKAGGAGGPTMPVLPRSGEDPMSLLGGFTPTSSLYGAASGVLDARHARAQAESDLNTLEASNEATAEQIQAAKNKLLAADQNIYQTELRLQEAKQSALDKYTSQMEKATDSLESVGAQLDSDFGVSKGLAGIADNITKFLLNLALVPVMAQLKGVQAAAGYDPANAGKGLMGVLGAQGAFGPQYTQAAQQAAMASGSAGTSFGGGATYGGASATSAASIPGAGGNVNAMLALAQSSSGKVDYAPASDLINGLADCSGSISDLYEVLQTGQTTSGREFTTTNFASDAEAAKLGFLPGFQPGALNVGVNPYPGMSGHMAATLPNGVNFEGGGGTGGGALYGAGASGALDPQFDKQYYLPVGGGAPGGSGGGGGGAAAPSGGGWAGPGVPAGLSGGGGRSPIFGGVPQGPGVGGGLGGPGMPGIGMPGVGGGLEFGGSAPSQSVTGGRSYGQGIPASGGIGFGGGMIGAAAGAAGMGMNLMAPGSGAGAQIGMDLAMRAVGAGGQYAANAVGGLLETFMLNDSALGDPGKSWFGRLAIGVAGMRPALPNSAGEMGGKQNEAMAEGGKKPAPALTPQQAEAAKASAGKGADAVQAKGGDTNITVNNQRATEDGTGRDIQAHLGSQRSAGGGLGSGGGGWGGGG